MKPLRIFIGYDERAPLQYAVLAHSIAKRSSKPVSITPLVLESLPIERRGLTKFTYSRFLVPYLCDYEGWGLFIDSDMLVTGDIAELFDCGDRHRPIHVRTDLPPQLHFERGAVMLFNCGHEWNKVLTPEYIDDPERCKAPHLIDWLDQDMIGSFPADWHRLVLYETIPDSTKLYHYTGGVPIFPETRGCPGTTEFFKDAQEAAGVHVTWEQIMGPSVHVPAVKRFNEARAKVDV